MTDIKIEKGIPIPTPYNKYPWKLMEAGDSFFVDKPHSSIALSRRRAEKTTGYKFLCRKAEGGTRVWRIA